MTTRTGGCLCGAVRFEIAGEPLLAGACFCRDCQIVAGGGAGYGMLFPKQALTVKAGETRTCSLTAASGNTVYREFCPACGVHLFSYNSGHPDSRAVKVGVLDDPSEFQSQGTLWTASAQPWHRIDPDAPHWETQPTFDEFSES